MKKFIVIILIAFLSLNLHSQNIKKLGYIFDSKSFHFGDVEQWMNQAAVFTFTNKTNHIVTVLPIFNENDLEVIIPERTIQIGETIQIKAKYYTSGKGSFSRKFNVYFAKLEKPVVLKITGDIKSLSPTAYIQCPMSRPSLAKAKIELIGDVADIETAILLNQATIEIIGLQNDKQISLFTSKKGKFGEKLPVGNYQIIVKHKGYHSYNGPFYLGQTSPPLRIRLTPIKETVYAEVIPNKPRKQENNVFIEQKKDNINITEKKKEPKKIKQQKIHKTNKQPSKNSEPNRNIDYVKNEPKDNLYSKNKKDKVPSTLTTYKESKKPKKEDAVYDTFDSPTDNEIVYNKQTPKEEKEKPTNNNTSKQKKYKEKNPKKEKTTKSIKKPKVVEPIVPTNKYTFRVLDEKTLEPISDASVVITEYYNKRNKNKLSTNNKGYSQLEVAKNDYKYLASAEGYVSNEIKIFKDDDKLVYRIMLSPISEMLEDIYEAKKAEQNDEDVLEKLSFGKKKALSFRNDDLDSNTEDVSKPSFVTNNAKNDREELENKQKADSLKLYLKELDIKNKENEKELALIAQAKKEKLAKEKEDSLNQVIRELALKNEEREKNLERIKQERIVENKKRREKIKLDSLTNFIAQLQNKNNELENDLDKVNNEKNNLEKNKRKQDEIAKLEEPKEKEQVVEPVLSKTKYAANNIIFLIDISTSMGKNKRMEMLKKSIKNLATVLRDIDRVAIISYNQKTKVVLESINGNNTLEIISAIDSLKTGGLTNGVKGITSAYEMLDYYFVPNGNNQIILATDGLFSKNNNEMTEKELNRLVKKQAEKNMKLTVVGFGKVDEGKDLMTKLAKSGTGQYIQIKNDWMTKDILIKEIQLNSKK